MLELGQIKISLNTMAEYLAEVMPESVTDDGRIKGDTSKTEREYLRAYTREKLHVSDEDMRKFEIHKRSIDARNKPVINYIYSVRFLSDIEEKILKNNKKNKNLRQVSKPILYESKLKPIRGFGRRIVVVGSGPCGLFAAYALSLRGITPVVIERGAPIEERVGDVERFWEQGVLNEESNVCFGEGGAGAFSDGKLNSGVKDRDGAKRFILETFVRFGARKEILYDAKPHIGTDVLRTVIVNMRKAMERAGVTFFFHTKMNGILRRDGHITGLMVEQDLTGQTDGAGSQGSPFEEMVSETVIECDDVVLAIGHSARDTFELLFDDDIKMIAKPFAVGVRVQHRQSDIDRAQYGEDAGSVNALTAAYYKLTGKTDDGRGVYSFCMCPGGYVVNAASEPEHLVVNGMSDVDRDSGYANAAIVVTVDPSKNDTGPEGAKSANSSGSESESDTSDESVFAGVNYQRDLERAMYELAAGDIPVQRYRDFKVETAKNDRSGESGNEVHGSVDVLSKNQPSVKGSWVYADVASALPGDISDAVVQAIDQFGKRIKGFDSDDTLILGVESRTSSPVRIPRDEDSLQSVSLAGLYPCGEGAGYAGGILSAAMDGLKVAEKICEEN